MSRPQTFENLLKINALKEASRDQASIEQFVTTAQALCDDADNDTLSPQGRFIMAYEGLHSLAMAVLNHYETRAGDGEGHRVQALQLAVQEMELETVRPGAFKTVSSLHRLRNDKIYRQPIPPVSKAHAEAAVELLKIALGQARALIGLPTPAVRTSV